RRRPGRSSSPRSIPAAVRRRRSQPRPRVLRSCCPPQELAAGPFSPAGSNLGSLFASMTNWTGSSTAGLSPASDRRRPHDRRFLLTAPAHDWLRGRCLRLPRTAGGCRPAHLWKFAHAQICRPRRDVAALVSQPHAYRRALVVLTKSVDVAFELG